MIVLLRKSVLLSLILLTTCTNLRSQNDPYRAEIGFQAGLNVYSGDVNTIADGKSYLKNLKNLQPDFGLMFRYRFNQRFAVRLGYDYTSVGGNYQFIDGLTTHSVALRNRLHIIDLWGEFNFFDLENNPYKRFSKRFSPFIFAGASHAFMPDYKANDSINTLGSFMIPFGVGFKWKMADKWNLNIQYVNRLQIGDNLEGKRDFDNPPPVTYANPMNNDVLSGFTIGISYDFWTRDCDCMQGFSAAKRPKPQKAEKPKRVRIRD